MDRRCARRFERASRTGDFLCVSEPAATPVFCRRALSTPVYGAAPAAQRGSVRATQGTPGAADRIPDPPGGAYPRTPSCPRPTRFARRWAASNGPMASSAASPAMRSGTASGPSASRTCSSISRSYASRAARALPQLPRDLQRDVRVFFSSYSRACSLADDLLFSAGDRAAVDQACRSAAVGKLTRQALYVHESALPQLPPILRTFEGCARAYIGVVEGANIIKLHRDQPQVSYLSYPDFERDPHPALASSLLVPLADVQDSLPHLPGRRPTRRFCTARKPLSPQTIPCMKNSPA